MPRRVHPPGLTSLDHATPFCKHVSFRLSAIPSYCYSTITCHTIVLYHQSHVCCAGDRTSACMGGGFASSPGVPCTLLWATSTWWAAQTGKALESFLKVHLKPCHCTWKQCCDCTCTLRNMFIYVFTACPLYAPCLLRVLLHMTDFTISAEQISRQKLWHENNKDHAYLTPCKNPCLINLWTCPCDCTLHSLGDFCRWIHQACVQVACYSL